MKLILRIVPILIAATAIAHSQSESGQTSGDTSAPPVVTSARILGNIPDGTPLAPQPPRPEFIIPANDVLDTTTHQQGGRTITIRQIKPIDLPPPPVPAAAPTAEEAAEFAAQLAGYRVAHPKSGLLFLSATVFRSSDSPPRTLVRYWPEGNGGSITFWSSADFSLIAGGIQSFVDSAGHSHSIMMSWSNADFDRMTDLQANLTRAYQVSLPPDFPQGNATWQIAGTQPAADELVVIQSLHDIYNSEHARLLTAYQGREQARIAREADLKAHPPQPKDITLNYWRTEKPAAAGNGGAR